MKKMILTMIATLFALSVFAGDGWKEKKQKGSGFNSAAERYEQKAAKLREMSQNEADPTLKKQYAELADKKSTLATHKRNAQKASEDGKGYDWNDYHKTQAEAKALWGEIEGKRKVGMKKKDMEKKEKSHSYKKYDEGKTEVKKHDSGCTVTVIT